MDTCELCNTRQHFSRLQNTQKYSTKAHSLTQLLRVALPDEQTHKLGDYCGLTMRKAGNLDRSMCAVGENQVNALRAIWTGRSVR